jgi:DNA ligase-associated metallophosphoesterase
MAAFLPTCLLDNHFLVTARGSLYWENEKILILSDLHLGKAGHFRKSGIGIPQSVMLEDMQRLFADIQFYKPQKLVIVGDLFHSTANKENAFFLKWRNDLGGLPIVLVKGNHDILPDEWYVSAGIEAVKGPLCIGDFIFVHDPADLTLDTGKYCFSGHIHPGIRLKGMGRQSLQLPCFYFGKQQAILPAFGKFTGTHAIRPEKNDTVFALADGAVVRVNGK